MKKTVKTIHPKNKETWRIWLAKNHDKETKIGLIIWKKHTGKTTISHRESMDEAICFGWIDTIVKKLDEDRYIRYFSRRNKNSSWSKNTLSYAKQLIKNKKMTAAGLDFYKLGLKKKPLDHGLEKNPSVPEELKKALNKNKIAKNNFEHLASSHRKAYLRWLLKAKRSETKEKRIKTIIARSEKGLSLGF